MMDVLPMYSRLQDMLDQKRDKDDADFDNLVCWMKETKPVLDILTETVFALQREIQEQRELITQMTWSSLIDETGESD